MDVSDYIDISDDLSKILIFFDDETSHHISELITHLKKTVLTELKRYFDEEKSGDIQSRSVSPHNIPKIHIRNLKEEVTLIKQSNITESEEKLDLNKLLYTTTGLFPDFIENVEKSSEEQKEETRNITWKEQLFEEKLTIEPPEGCIALKEKDYSEIKSKETKDNTTTQDTDFFVDNDNLLERNNKEVQSGKGISFYKEKSDQDQQEDTQNISLDEQQSRESYVRSKQQGEPSDSQETYLTLEDNQVEPLGKTEKSLPSLGNLIPRGIARRPGENLYVADWNCKCIRVYNPECKHDRNIKTREINPWGVALYHNYLYISDNRTHKVFRVQLKGDNDPVSLKIPKGLNSPRGIAVTSDGILFIADCNNDRIVRYDNGKCSILESYVINRPVDVEIIGNDLYILCICLEGGTREIYVLKRPIDSLEYTEILRDSGVNAFFFCIHEDTCYISDMLAHCIRIYDLKGGKRGQIPENKEEGHDKGQLFYPSGVIVDEDNSMIVVASSNRNNRVQNFPLESYKLK